MNFEQMKALMGENATDEQIQKALDAVKAETAKAVEAETNGLKENKTKLLTQMDKLKKNQVPEGFDVEGFEKYKTDAAELEKKQKELADAELEGKGQWDALKMQLNTAHATALTTAAEASSATISSLRKALDKELIENNAIKAIELEKGNSLFLLPHMRGSMKTVETENGGYEVHVLDKEGNRRFQDDATTPFEVKDLVAEFKANETYAPAFPGLNSGSGNDVNSGGKGGTGVNPWKPDTKNVTMQAQITRDNPTLATQMKKAAGVAS